ncbi:MAG: hypothetical protein RBR67_20620 [Desulfobacterium sp.]|nr:hypothetical protein [Desulfobacterium sp.]
MKKKLLIFLIFASTLFSDFAWADLSQNEVSQLYVSIIGRASEGSGNIYWQTAPCSMPAWLQQLM